MCTQKLLPLHLQLVRHQSMKAYWLSSQVFHPCMFLMSGEVVDSISNLHELIGHCCVPFPLITEAWHFSLSFHLIYAQIIHSLVNHKVSRQQSDSSRCVFKKMALESGICSLFVFAWACAFIYGKTGASAKPCVIVCASWWRLEKVFSSSEWDEQDKIEQ